MRMKKSEIIGMKLGDLLPMLPKGTYIAVGARSSLVFVDTVERFFADHDGILNRYVNYAKANIERRCKLSKDEHYYINYLETVKPFMDRKIINICQRKLDIEPTVTVIRVEGEEFGKYWLLKEYRSGIVEGREIR